MSVGKERWRPLAILMGLAVGSRVVDRVLDVELQGETVAAGLDIVQAAGGSERALTREFNRVEVTDNLVVELSPKKGESILSAIEVERE